MRTRFYLATIAAALLLSGCATYSYTDAPSSMGFMYSKYAYVAYDGKPLPFEEIGVVTTDGLIKIKNVEGQPLSNFTRYYKGGMYSGGRFQLHLLPGTYTLEMGYSMDLGTGHKSWSLSDVKKTITIEAGEIKHLSLWQNGSKWGVNETDGKKAIDTIKRDFSDLAMNGPK